MAYSACASTFIVALHYSLVSTDYLYLYGCMDVQTIKNTFSANIQQFCAIMEWKERITVLIS